MRVIHWLGTSIVIASLTGLALSSASCGDDAQIDAVDGSTESGGGDGDVTGEAGFVDGNGGEAGDGAPNNCAPTGTTCATSGDCCSANCDPKLHVCASSIGSCKPGGQACAAATDCCTLVCSGGTCGSKLCTSDNQNCAADAECCGGKCTGGKCAALNGSCKTSGNTCAQNGDCCSKFCNSGVCNNQPSFCTQTNDVCSSNFECCTNTCTKQAGAALGTCGTLTTPGVPGCTIAGQLCGAGANDGGALLDGGVPPCGGECCSRSCGPYAKTGVFICEPPSGCRPTGETCRGDKDCCGFGGVQGSTGVGTCSFPFPGAPVGRCDNGNACRPAGAICKVNKNRYPDIASCNAENNCCSGNVNQNEFVCTRDTLGIPRCTIAALDCDGGAPKAGLACASSADCCGLNCVPNPAFTGSPPSAPFVCSAGCVQKGNACTSTADCCSGTPCVQAPGTSVGVCGGVVQSDGGVAAGDSGPGATGSDGGACSLSGQTCGTSGDCCANSGLTCTNGRCGVYLR